MAELSPGMVLGNRFQIAGVLGTGGMATVYLAHDQLRGDRVALKVLHDHLSNTPSMRDRLRREVLAAGRIRHPHAVVASDLHELDGHLVLSLPLHPGHTLAEHLETKGPLSADDLIRMGTQLAGALAEAHSHGVVHRDITPTNVMIDEKGDAALTDFGLARLEDLRMATATGVVGTCGYAAPEVYQGERADPRSDVYSLGAVLYQAATGKPPFEAPNPMGVMRRQLEENFIPLATARPDLPPPLVSTIEGMLRREPSRRPQGALEVAESLESEEAPEPEPVERPAAERPAAEARGAQGGATTGAGATAAGDASSGTGARSEASASGGSSSASRPGLGLPAGDWTVVVRERQDDRGRRERARHRHRQLRHRQRRSRGARPEFEIHIEALVEQVKARVKALLNLPNGRTPEEMLSQAVALEAGLPEGALTMPEAMLRRHFRLVEAVDESCARRLADVADQSGFKAQAIHLTKDGPPTSGRWRLAPWPVVALLILAAAAPELIVALAVMFIAFLVVGKQLKKVAQENIDLVGLAKQALERGIAHLQLPHDSPERHPLAYGRDLRPHLARGHEQFYNLLEPRIERAGEVTPSGAGVTMTADVASSSGVAAGATPNLAGAAEGAGRAAAGRKGTGGQGGLEAQARAEAPTKPSTPADRLQGMIERTTSQLDALERALAEEGAALPPVVVEDLRKTLEALREQAKAFGREASRIQLELSSFDDSAAATAATRIEARLKRLRTLQRAGDKVNEEEIAALERGLEAHRRTLEGVEVLEGQLTQAQARLLEIGAAATQARRQLLREKGPGQSALKLLEQLNGQVSAAAQALREVEVTPPALEGHPVRPPVEESEPAPSEEPSVAARAAQATRQRML